MDVLNSITIDLPATRTYARRECQWFGKDSSGFAGVILRLWGGRRAGSKMVERDFYEVVETDPDPGLICRQFVFLNRTDPGQQLPYKVRIGLNHSCTCDAGRARVPGEKNITDGCKHRDCVREVLESGWWDGLHADEQQGRYEDAPGERTIAEMVE